MKILFGLNAQQKKEELGLPDVTDKIVEMHVQATGIRHPQQLQEALEEFKVLTLKRVENPYFDYEVYKDTLKELAEEECVINDDRILFFLEQFKKLTKAEVVYAPGKAETDLQKALQGVYDTVFGKQEAPDTVDLSAVLETDVS